MAWLAVWLSWVLVFRNYSFSLTKSMTIEFCYLLFITGDFYIILYGFVPRLLKKRRHVLFFLSSVLLIGFSAWLRALLSREMNIHIFDSRPLPSFGRLFVDSFLNIFIWTNIILTVKMLLDRAYNQQQFALLEQERVKHELDFLKAQINPHALFNSLNSIYGHIDKNNQTARDILLKFSGLLRYQLYDCTVDRISLAKEIEYLRNYISLQQVRKEENLIVDLGIQDGNAEYVIAPLLLVILVENAFKFVSNFTSRPNKIVIRAGLRENLFSFYVFNTTECEPPASTRSSGGIGLVNLRRRLELLYPGKYEMAGQQQEGFYETSLEIEL